MLWPGFYALPKVRTGRPVIQQLVARKAGIVKVPLLLLNVPLLYFFCPPLKKKGRQAPQLQGFFNVCEVVKSIKNDSFCSKKRVFC
jgi:hypothetical protein